MHEFMGIRFTHHSTSTTRLAGVILIASAVQPIVLCAGGETRDSNVSVQVGQKSEQVDLIELNHFIDDEGREVFRQLVFYDWSEFEKRFHVRAWRLIKCEQQLPRRFWKPQRYECRWHDDGVSKTVSARQLRETWTQQDPERVNRKFLPEDQRVPLFAKD
jgi:hypothetical protein